MSDPFVFKKMPSFLQRAGDLVRTGHRYWVGGVVELDKLPAFYAKMHARYNLEMSPVQATRARQKGIATARLLFWHPDNYEQALWVLVRSEGELSALAKDAREKWKDAYGKEQERLHLKLGVFEGARVLELVRITKKHHSNPVWTWRYEKASYQDFRQRIIDAIRHKRDDQLKQLIHMLWIVSPGFGGVREQVKKLEKLIRAEWKRSRRPAEAMPPIPQHLGYLRRVKDKGLPYSTLMRKNAREIERMIEMEREALMRDPAESALVADMAQYAEEQQRAIEEAVQAAEAMS